MKAKREQKIQDASAKKISATQRWTSRGKLVVGAAGLFLFIVGVKRSFRDPPPDPANQPDPIAPVA